MVKPVACVIGWPVKHSRSPVIHRFWLNELGIDGDYVIQPVEPERIAAFFAGLPDSGFVGCNVTVPHKEAAFAAVARREAAAEETGALNTVWIEGRQARRHQHRPRRLPRQSRRRGVRAGMPKAGPAVVLGAGGAARAIVWALLSRGFAPVHVVNRTPAARRGARRPLRPAVSFAGWAALPQPASPARASWSTPPRSACTASRRSTSMSRACRRTRWSTISSMCRWRRR